MKFESPLENSIPLNKRNSSKDSGKISKLIHLPAKMLSNSSAISLALLQETIIFASVFHVDF
jgi:hypothetical protein